MSTTNENKQLTKEQVINRNNLYININMTGCKDRVMSFLLFTIEHLENVNNTKVSHQFLAKQVNASIETVKRKLKKLRDLELISWVSGKNKKEANTYTINHTTYDELKYKLNSFNKMTDRLDFINDFFKQKPTASLMFNSTKEVDKQDTDDVIDNDTEAFDTTNDSMKNMVKIMLGQQKAPSPVQVSTPSVEEPVQQVGQIDTNINNKNIVLGTEASPILTDKEEIQDRIENLTSPTDDEVRQLFKDNGDEWLLDKWFSGDKSPEEIKLLIDTRIEIYNREDEVEEVSLFDDEYLNKLYPNKKFISTEFGTYEEVVEGMEEYIEQIIEEERYIA